MMNKNKRRYFFKNGVELNPENAELMKELEKTREDLLDIWMEEIGEEPTGSIRRIMNSWGHNEKINFDQK